MADNQTRVIYKAIADFSAASRAARRLKRDIQDLRREEARLNAQSVAGSAAATVAAGKHVKSREDLVDAFESEAGAVRRSTVRFIENAKAAEKDAEATEQASQAHENIAVTTEKWRRGADGVRRVIERNGKAVDSFTNSTRRGRHETTALGNAFNRTIFGATKLDRALNRIGNWRPRLVPPFIALIPVIGGIIALLNPLISGLGAVGAAGLGFASSLGRVAASAIGLVPTLATLISMVTALKVAFGGIGNAFKAFGAMRDAAGGGGGGAPARAELTQTEEITRAQEAYARSIQDVAWAQEDLDDARKDYIKRLRELQKAVDRAAMSEARAAANAQLARENYANVLADPGSTKGQKMDALVGVDEAQADLQDVIDQNLENQAALLEMQQKGIEGDRQVIQATRALTDAINRQRDAELDLINAQNGANRATGGGASAAAEYQRMLAKLSPSARRFVETLVSMSEAWEALQRRVQETFFSQFVDSVERLRGLLPEVESLLSNTAGAVGRVVDRFLRLITSPEWERDLVLIGEQNVPIIENTGDAALSLLNVLRDLAVAAGPFVESLSEGLREGAANFERIVAAARADGSLASYLERVRASMSQWWRIVKNVGQALFNYSAAAGEFGQWLTDGLERITEGWLEASQRAREEGSPFQQYLENIKPLLSEVQNLFADFFAWFARVASDPDNIRQFTEIVYLLRTELGPALSEILDLLTKSGVGEDFVRAIISIVEAIATLLENGGVEGIKAFYNTVSTLFDALNGFLKAIPEPVLQLLMTTFGTLAALRFFGLTKVLGLLISLAKSGRIMSILDKVWMAFGGGGRGAHAARGGGALAGAGARIGGAAAGVAGAARGGVQNAISFLSGLGGKVTGSAGAKAGQGFNLLGSIAKGAGRGVGLGAIASIIGTVGGDLISSSAPEGEAGSGQRVGGNTLAGAATGAGIGALVGSIIPGLGTAIGAAIGGVVGGGVGLATSDPDDLAQMWEDWGNFFSDVGKWLGEVWDGFMNWLTVDLPAWLGDVGEGFMNWLTVDLPAWLGSIADGFLNWLTVDLPYSLGYAAGLFWNWLTVDMPAWLASVWNGFMTWLTVDMPAWLASVWNGFMNWLTVDLPAWLSQTAQGFWNWLTVDLPAWLGQAATAFWNWLTVDVPAWIGQAATGFWNWLTVEVPNGIGQAASSFWKFLTEDIPNWIGEAANAFWTWLTVDIPNSISQMWNDFWGSFGQGFSDATQGKRNGGSILRRAGGGGVPGRGNSDTVPAMLTPGEFVIRKAVVANIGVENLTKLNAGVMSYAEMLQRALAEQSGGSKQKDDRGGGFSFFDGGGLVPGNPFGGFGGDQPPGPDFGSFGGPGGGEGPFIGSVIINNPAPEPASDSLPRTIRKVAYLDSKR